ncbi:MAG: rod shape-determining protein MreD [Chloroflexota bacterium]
MRSLIIGIPLLALISVMQSTLLHSVRFLDGSVDMALVVVLAWNLVRREADAPLWAFFAGVFADALSGGAIGAATFAMTTISLVISFTEGRFYQANLPVALLVSLVGTIFYHLLYLLTLSIRGQPIQWADAITLGILPSALLNLILIVPIYRIALWAVKLLKPREIGLLEE